MAASRVFVRENRIRCGDSGFEMVEIYQYTDEGQAAAARKRKPRERITPEKIRRMNEKRAKRYFYALLNTNFGAGDIHLTLTYNQEHLPADKAEADKLVRKYLRRVKARREALGLSEMKYIVVTEFGEDKRTGEVKRIHHHIVMSGGVDRDDLELMWTNARINWKRAGSDAAYRRELEGKRLGFANADRLKPGEDGLGAIAKYLMKNPAGKRRWTASRNLEKPTRTKNDHKYSRRKLVNLCMSGDVYSREWWEKAYPGRTLAGVAALAVDVLEPDDMNNWVVYAKLRRVDR